MNILLITKTYPYPDTDGLNLRLFNLFKCLARYHQVFISCLDNSHKNTVNTASGNIFQPLNINIDNLVKNGTPYDLMVLGGYRTIKNFSLPIKKPVIVDLIDDVYLSLMRGTKFEPSWLRKLQLLKWAFAQQKVEREWGRRFSNFIVASPEDAASLQHFCPNAKITAIANGVDTDFFTPELNIENGYPTLVFSGSLDYAPNNDAAYFLLNKIYPLIKRRIPLIKLIIAGRSPSIRICRLAENDKDIIITGFVEDIRRYIAQAMVYICPLRWGTGVKNKILEAWAMGKAIVATSVSCEGLNTVHGENILIADTAVDFTKAVNRLIEDSRLRNQLGKNGRRLVEREYLWEQKAKEYEVFLKEALKQQ